MMRFGCGPHIMGTIITFLQSPVMVSQRDLSEAG
jgi:hypothetical protein